MLSIREIIYIKILLFLLLLLIIIIMNGFSHVVSASSMKKYSDKTAFDERRLLF